MAGSHTIDPSIPLIERAELLARLHDPALKVVDVLPRVSWQEGHIPGALCLPLDEIPEHARELLPDPRADIVVFCGGPT